MNAGGAVPLALLITEGQTAEEYTSVFTLLKKAIGEFGFGGLGSPYCFLTDDSDAERMSLGNVFPNAKLLLCIFHIGQSIWRWLCNAKHNILEEDRPILFRLFQQMYSARSTIQAQEAFELTNTSNISLKYLNWIKYMSKYWERKECWCVAYRDTRMRGNQTNNFTVRIFKDIILQRYKSYNGVILVDSICTDEEKYYVDKYSDYAHGRIDKKRFHLQFEFDKSKYLKKEMIVKKDDDNFLIPSETITGKIYEVDFTLGHCTCEIGRFGKICKHQIVVYSLHLNISEDDTAEERYS
ncbi:uncharacterized protein LOC143916730 [Arctopsyche grandis]|uniref:uncharacterized protein LOC143916730 n=1 Tax=Arctopsyche grandis TaxID=121162 RepID=UPI00406DA30B